MYAFILWIKLYYVDFKLSFINLNKFFNLGNTTEILNHFNNALFFYLLYGVLI